MNPSPAHRARAVALACMCIAVAPSSIARASAPAAPAAPAPSGEADRLFQEGIAARKAGNLTSAEALFRKAWASKKTWDIAANLGLVEFNLGKLAGGAEHVSYAIANLPPSESDATRESLTKALAAAKPELAEITVRCDVGGAEVRAGAELKGTTPLSAPIFALPGQIKIEVSKDGYATVAKRIEAKKGSSQEVTFALVKQAPPAEGPRKEIIIGGAALAGAGLITGIATGIAAGIASNDATKQRDALLAQPGACLSGANSSACAALEAKRAEQTVLTNVALFSFIGAGAAGIGTAAYALIMRSKAPPAAVSVAPVVGENSGGIAVTGRF